MADADRALSEQRSLVQRLDAEASAAKRELHSAMESSASLAARNEALDEELASERERIQVRSEVCCWCEGLVGHWVGFAAPAAPGALLWTGCCSWG